MKSKVLLLITLAILAILILAGCSTLEPNMIICPQKINLAITQLKICVNQTAVIGEYYRMLLIQIQPPLFLQPVVRLDPK